MIVDPATILRGLAADLRAEAPVVTVGDLFDVAVMQLVEDGRDWRELSARASKIPNERRFRP